MMQPPYVLILICIIICACYNIVYANLYNLILYNTFSVPIKWWQYAIYTYPIHLCNIRMMGTPLSQGLKVQFKTFFFVFQCWSELPFNTDVIYKFGRNNMSYQYQRLFRRRDLFCHLSIHISHNLVVFSFFSVSFYAVFVGVVYNIFNVAHSIEPHQSCIYIYIYWRI